MTVALLVLLLMIKIYLQELNRHLYVTRWHIINFHLCSPKGPTPAFGHTLTQLHVAAKIDLMSEVQHAIRPAGLEDRQIEEDWGDNCYVPPSTMHITRIQSPMFLCQASKIYQILWTVERTIF